MLNRSASSIALYWSLPTQVVIEERGTQLRKDGTCRFCGHNEGADLGFVVADCPYLTCADAYERTPWARCSCCDEHLPLGNPCLASLADWPQNDSDPESMIQVQG